MNNISLTLQFDGSHFHGWQIQKNAMSVCEVLTNAVYAVTGEYCNIVGCSRTDAGVHAVKYVCSFKSGTTVPPDKLHLALNTKLPPSIRVLSSAIADDDFHARFSAKSKTYLYKVNNSSILSPFHNNYYCHFPQPTDFAKIEQAAAHFVGTHDFSAFMAAGSSQKTTVRTVNYLKVRKDCNNLEFEINATAYLYNMVRIIAGTLLYVGYGKIDPSDIPRIIEGKDRKNAGITAVPDGLYLAAVEY